ncbi:MAG: septum formation initiator family protein [Sphingomonadales bacterium]|nr:septum formation initiator family protein [Sphingomonadales bacterium]
MKEFLYSTLQILKIRYVWVGLALLLWMIFFDRDDLITGRRITLELKKLEESKASYIEKVDRVRQDRDGLLGDTVLLMRFGREQFGLLREGEVVFKVDEDRLLEAREND